MLAVASDQRSLALDALRAHEQAQMSPEERAAAERVADFDAEETTCPACGETFRTELGRCSECGLNFG